MCHQLEQTHAELVPILHHRASLWYAQHDQTTQAILHALCAKNWQWAADLIERAPLMSLTWGAGEHDLVLLRHWLEQLPPEIVHSRPRLCLACTQLLWAVAPHAKLQVWLKTAEATLVPLLSTQMTTDPSETSLALRMQREDHEHLLGEVIAFGALLQSTQERGHVIEIRLLQTLTHQMCHEETQALDALSEAIRLAEPESYIRSFVEEGASMEALLYRLRKRDRKQGPTPYLDTLLAAFQQESESRGIDRRSNQGSTL